MSAGPWRDRPVTVRAPATSANLGPGFDALGLALGLHDEVQARAIGGGLRIEVTGVGAGTAGHGEQHLVVRAMRAAFDALGGQPSGIGLRCVNAIPHGFGLGSSAAAIVAGILAARALRVGGEEELPDDAVLRLAADLEGHADNVAACLAGGLTIAWTGGGQGAVRCVRLEPLPGLTPVLCVPAAPLATVQARQVLPATVPHADAAKNAARSALLVAALTRGAPPADPGVMLDATQDFLHQPYRADSMPRTAELVGALREAGIPAVVSGAGPAALALVVPGVTAGPDAVAATAAAAATVEAATAAAATAATVAAATDSGHNWTVRVLSVDRVGAAVTR